MLIYASLLLLMLATIMLMTWVLVRRSRRLKAAGTTLSATSLLQHDAQALYLRLQTALPQYLIFAHVNLAVFIQAHGGTRYGISLRHAELSTHMADFLICSSDFRIVAAIDLDNIGKNRSFSDRCIRLLREASIPVLHWTTVNLPTVRDIQEAVAELETAHLLLVSLQKSASHDNRPGIGCGSRNRRERRS